MLTPVQILIEYQKYCKDHGQPSRMTINPDTWDHLTKPDPAAHDPKPQPKTFQGVPVDLDPTYPPDYVTFE